MAITLLDLRKAVQTYLDTHVTVTISAVSPTTIQPNDKFTFSITGHNSGAFDAIRLVNVRYHLKVLDPSVVKLVVPTSNPYHEITYKSAFGPTQLPQIFPLELAPNSEVGEMYLFPPPLHGFAFDTAGDLSEWDFDTITELTGKAGPASAGKSTSITCRILAEPDLSFLFPKNEDSPTVTKVLTVTAPGP